MSASKQEKKLYNAARAQKKFQAETVRFQENPSAQTLQKMQGAAKNYKKACKSLDANIYCFAYGVKHLIVPADKPSKKK